jgi:hypothetical protein
MTTCPNCELPLHDGETCQHALGRALADSSREIKSLRNEVALLAARKAATADAPRWRGTLRG